MARRPPVFRPHGPATRQEQERQADRRRGSARERGYDHHWDKAAKAHLDEHPLCAYCAAGAFGQAATTEAVLVDHFVPHRGNREIFWFRPWWVSSCTPCHSGPKQALEARGLAALRPLAERLGLPLSMRPDDASVG